MYRLCVPAVALLLAGCSSFGLQSGRAENAAPAPRPEPESLLQTDPRAQTLYRLLVAEFAGQRGDIEAAARAYVEAAETSDDPAIAERAARLAVYSGSEDLAVRATQRWLELEPDSRTARRVAALAALRSGDVERTVTAFLSSLPTEGEAREQALAEIGALLSQHADVAMARQVAQRLAERLPESRMAQLVYAQIALRAGDAAQAVAVLDRTLALSPGWQPARLLRVEALLVQGRADAALADLEQFLETHPDDFELRLLYARTLVSAGRNADALAQFERLLEQAPDDPRVLQPAGLLALELGRPEAAERWLGRLLETGEQADLARYYLGRLAEAQDQPERAREYYSRTGGRFRAEAILRIAVLTARDGNVAEARERLAQLRADRPDMAVAAWAVEGELLRAAGRAEEAVDVYTRALESEPKSVDLLYGRAMAYIDLERIDLAEADLRAMLAEDPNDPNALNALGYTLADRTERLAEADALVTRAYELDPSSPAIIDSMGWVAYRQGRLEEALDYLREAYRLSEGNAEIAAHLGEVLWMMGRHEEARRIFESALERMPDSELLQRVWNRLRQ
jgi:tetratricopeptide (TPR) repeat protein